MNCRAYRYKYDLRTHIPILAFYFIRFLTCSEIGLINPKRLRGRDMQNQHNTLLSYFKKKVNFVRFESTEVEDLTCYSLHWQALNDKISPQECLYDIFFTHYRQLSADIKINDCKINSIF